MAKAKVVTGAVAQVAVVAGNISVDRICLVKNGKGLLAYEDLKIGDWVVKGFKVIQGKNGLFISCPQSKGSDGKWRDTAWPNSREARNEMEEVVIAAYKVASEKATVATVTK